ncbi:Aspartic peptidase [Trema orientale]|uniref:Aspartic peptidase n=1 Tax=Trema orientale TaxID=63057 RepID=A0A2P5EGH6_TREOI|nr:Aspartic peptidase [Trema orientale]
MANVAISFLGFKILSILFFFLLRISIGKLDGLTLKLIHRDSPESPLHRAHLTRSERTEKLILQSLARTLHQTHHYDHNLNTTEYFTNTLHSKVGFQKGSVFMAQVGIGTFRSPRPNSPSALSYFLHMDTGSNLMWTQCEACKARGNHCFYQKQPIFPDSQSSSYKNLPCNRHPLCFPNKCVNRFCSYDFSYADGSGSKGYLASETFTFDSSSMGKETVQNIIFGCGFDQINAVDYGDENNVAGLLGLGWGPHSLVKQLGHRAQGRFSYCLQRMDDNNRGRNTFLRFGPDIPTRSGLQTTNLIQYGSGQSYYVNLVGISVAGWRLQIPTAYFARRGSRGGAIIDSGVAYSVIIKPAYDLLEGALVNQFFSRVMGLTRIHIPNFFNLCYQRSISGRGFGNLPNVTFHFSDANLLIQPQGAFYVDKTGDGKEYFCLAMVPLPLGYDNDGITSIGAYQQTNHRFIYDVDRKILQFRAEDCINYA